METVESKHVHNSMGEHASVKRVEKVPFFKHPLINALFPPGLLALLTGLVYFPSLQYPFQFDDIANISKRFWIRFDDPLARWWGSSRWFGDWLNMLNFKIGRFDPFYYRLCNVLIHFAAGICVFYIIYSLCHALKEKNFFQENALFLGFVTSGLFLLHPVQTQTVSYVIQARLEGLATLFVLGVILTFVKAVRAKQLWQKGLFTILCAVLSLVSCGTKELVIVLPALLILIDWFFIAQQDWSSMKKRLWVHALFTVYFVGLMVHYLGAKFATDALLLKAPIGNNRGNILTTDAFDMITPWRFLMSQMRVIIHYMTIFVWPFGISVEYDWKAPSAFFSPGVLFPFTLLVSLVGIIARWAYQKKYMSLVFGLSWFFIAISPRSSVIPSPELVCDYKTYLASVGIMFILATGIVAFSMRVFAWLHTKIKEIAFVEAQVSSLALCLLLVGYTAYERNRVWETCVAFWEDNAKKAPNKARVHNNFGVALSEVGRIDDSIQAYNKAIALDSHYADPLSNLAVAYSMKGEVDKAIDSLKGAINICPNYAEAYNNLGSLLLQKKLYSDAEKSLQIAIQIRPHYGKAFYNLARLYEEKGDHEKSWQFLKNATQGDLDTAEVFFKLGQMSLRVQKYDEAVKAFEYVLNHGIAQDQVWFNLANAYYMLNQHERAQSIYERLVRDNPLDPRFAYNLGEAYFTRNNFQRAFEMFRKATLVPQPIPQAFFRVVHCLERMNNVDDAKKYLNDLLALNAADDFKSAVKGEIMRIDLQQKVNNGNGSIKLSEIQNAIAANDETPVEKGTQVASKKEHKLSSNTKESSMNERTGAPLFGAWQGFLTRAIPGILALITFIVYFPSLWYGYVFDDLPTITNYIHIRHIDFKGQFFGNPRWISRLLNQITYHFWKINPVAYRLFNVTVHIAIGVMIFMLVLRLFKNLKHNEWLKTHALSMASVSSMLFLLHPAQTQTVTYVTQMRLEGLVVLFTAGVILAFAYAATTTVVWKRRLFYGISFVLTAFAAGTKEIIVVLPVLIVLVDWFFIAEGSWESFKTRLIYHAVYAGVLYGILLKYGLIKPRYVKMLAANSLHNNRGNVLTHDAKLPITWSFFALSQPKILLHYIGIFLLPLGLSFDYDVVFSHHWYDLDVFLPILLILGMAVGMAWLYVKYQEKILPFCYLWFLIAMLPRTSIFPSTELVCDYKTYPAAFGAILGLAYIFVVSAIWLKKQLRHLLVNYDHQKVVMTANVVACCLLVMATSVRNRVWESEYTLWKDVIEKAPKARALNNFAIALWEQGKVEDAMEHFHKAIAKDDFYAEPHVNLATIHQVKGENDKALDHYKRALDIGEAHPELFNNLGMLHFSTQSYDAAEYCFLQAIELRPYYSKTNANLGKLYQVKGNREAAMKYYHQALTGDDPDVEVYYLHGALSLEMGKADDALVSLGKVRKDYQDAAFLMGCCFYSKRNFAPAIEAFTFAHQKDPGNKVCTYNYAQALLNTGDYPGAFKLYKECLDDLAAFPYAPLHSAKCLYEMGLKDEANKAIKQLICHAPKNVADDARTLQKELKLA